jgi:hypothetical protein
MRGWVAIALVGCGKDEVSDPATCDGGGTPGLELGDGGQLAFAPWSAGDAVPITQQGDYGFVVQLHTTGLDTTATVVSFVRFAIGAETTTTDVGGSLTFQCLDDGTGWTQVFATLGDDRQAASQVAALDGEALHLTVTATDQAGDEADQSLELTLSAP